MRGEAGAVEDLDAAARVADHSLALQFTCGDGDGGALHAEHLGEELLGEVEDFGLHAVRGGEQPAGQARLDFVHPIAEDRLGDLDQLQIGEGMDELLQHAALEELGADDGGADAEAFAVPA